MDATIFYRVAALAALVSAHVAPPLAAQRAGLDARMAGLQRAVDSDRRDSVAGFFPRSGSWSWVQTVRQPRTDAIVMVGRWRFSPADARRVIGEGGPLCSFFEPMSEGGYGPFEGRLGIRRSGEARRVWRRARPHRFVPPDEPDDSRTFVEWRREAGRWVISAVGQETVFLPRSQVQRGAPGSATRYATDAEWHRQNTPIVLDGFLYVRYGFPRPLFPHEIERIGASDGVPAYVARGDTVKPDVVYVPVDASSFQPYQALHGRPLPCS